jgi:hypothetical protein
VLAAGRRRSATKKGTAGIVARVVGSPGRLSEMPWREQLIETWLFVTAEESSTRKERAAEGGVQPPKCLATNQSIRGGHVDVDWYCDT